MAMGEGDDFAMWLAVLIGIAGPIAFVLLFVGLGRLLASA